MRKWFLIKYVVDTGWEWIKDVALVEAVNEEEAKKYINNYIGKLGNEYMVNEISEVIEFTGQIFTSRHGYETL